MNRKAIVPCLIVSHVAAWFHMPLTVCGAFVIVGFGLLGVLQRPSQVVLMMPPAPSRLSRRVAQRRRYRGAA